MEKEFIFVYGTLMSGYPKNPFKDFLKKNANFMGKAKCKGKLFRIGTYPGLVENGENEDFEVYGEVYEIIDTKTFFDQLDDYEEYIPMDAENSIYKRNLIKVKLISSGEEFNCWAYLYNKPIKGNNFIKSGDFMN